MSTEAIFSVLALERQVEALLFAAAEPLSLQDLRNRLGDAADVAGALASLTARYAGTLAGSVISSTGMQLRLRRKPDSAS